MEIVFQAISILCWLMFVASIYLMFRTWRQAKPVKPKAIIIGQIIAVASLWLFTALTGFPLDGLSWLILLVVGVAGGVIYGNFVKVQHSEQGIVMTYTLRYLVTWAGLLALTQLFTIIWQQVPVILLGLSVVNMGLNLGMNGRVLFRYRYLKG